MPSRAQRRRARRASQREQSPTPEQHAQTAQEHLVNNPNQRIPKINLDAPPESGQVETLHGAKVLVDHEVELTKSKSFWYIDLPVFRGEREVADTHVQFLYDQMKLDRFNWRNVTLATAELDGVEYKINGQHTAWARSYMPDDYSPTVREIRWRVKNQEQLRALYSSFDAGKPRTEQHLTKVELSGEKMLESIWAKHLGMLAAATLFWKHEQYHTRQRYSAAASAQLVREHHLQLVQTVGLYYQSIYKDSKDIRRLPVIAAMLATFDKVPTVAPEFWTKVANGLDLSDKNDPRYRLRQFLGEHSLSTSRISDRTPIDIESMYRVCILCWNKWRKNESMQTAPRTTKERVRPT